MEHPRPVMERLHLAIQDMERLHPVSQDTECLHPASPDTASHLANLVSSKSSESAWLVVGWMTSLCLNLPAHHKVTVVYSTVSNFEVITAALLCTQLLHLD